LKNKIASAFKFIDFSPICEICLPTFYKGAFAKKESLKKALPKHPCPLKNS